nr:MAG TPA: hypothetical protein [Bacteriophage sp.]
MTIKLNFSVSATINLQKFTSNYIFINLHFDIPHNISSLFIVSHFIINLTNLVYITLQRLKFPNTTMGTYLENSC